MTYVASVAEVCNLALDRIGYRRSIANIYSGTAEARIALRAYAQTRDDLLKSKDWDFAERIADLAATSFQPPRGWQYSYVWPTDCLKVRYVSATSIGDDDLDPRPTLFDDLNESGQRVIVANISPASLTYTGQITDMTTWDAAFVELMVEELSRRFAEALGLAENVIVNRATMAQQADMTLTGSQATTPNNSAKTAAQPQRDRG